MLKNKITIVIIALFMAFAAVGCDNSSKTPTSPTPPSSGSEVTEPAVAPDFSQYEGDDLVIGGYIGHARRYAGKDGGKKEYRKLYAQYAREAGLNTIFGLRLAQISDPRIVEEILAAAEQENIGVLLSMQGLTYPDDVDSFVGSGESSAAFMGYDFWDEPGALSFGRLQKQMAQFKTSHPDKNAFVNLLPSYASWGISEQLQAEDYVTYVNNFTRDCPSASQVCLDHYPLIGTMAGEFAISSVLSSTWLSDLEVNARAAAAANKDLWCYAQGMAYGDRRVPESAADLKFQNYVSMCFGVKGLAYFCLDTPGNDGDGGEFGGIVYGMIDRDGNKTDIHRYAAEANAELKSFGYVYKQFKWQNVMTVTGSDDPDNAAFGNLTDAAVTASGFTASANHDTLIGLFEKDGQKAYMLVPYVDPHLDITGEDFQNGDTDVTLTFNTKHILVYGNGKSEVVAIPDGMYTTTLRPGDGRFIIPF